MVVIIILAQILAICVHAYLLWCEKKYCGHCDWWCDAGAIIFFIISLVPIFGLFMSIAGCVDYMRNITEELTKTNT